MNLPDDWGNHWRTCSRGHRWHASEISCCECADRAATIGESIAERIRNTAHHDPEVCECRGGGWMLSPWDTWNPCPAHPGMPHPEDYQDDPNPLPY